MSKISINDILGRAKTLRISEDGGEELYKILILAVTAGLRREEIDRLRWEDVDFERHRIIVRSSPFGMAKTVYSEGDVDIDESVSSLLSEFHRKKRGKFVVYSEVRPRPNALYPHYRCHALFRKLTKWLRENGVNSQKPLHELRKEFGSQICAQGGIYAASAQLRHADIRITRDHYLDKKNRITVSL